MRRPFLFSEANAWGQPPRLSGGAKPRRALGCEDVVNENLGELRSPGQPGAAVPTRVLNSKSYEYRLRLQFNSPRFLHAALDFIFEADNIACFRVSPIDQRQRMFFRDPCCPDRVSLRETRVLHQPCRRNLVLRIERGVTGNLKSSGFGALGQVFELLRVKHGILEERSGAAAIRVAFHEKHRFTRANAANRSTNFSDRARRALAFKFELNIGITNRGSAVVPEVVRHL